MRTAPAIALSTVGAILAYAVNASIPGVDINVVGTVLALVGLLWLAVEIGIEFAAMRRRRPRRERRPKDAAPPARQEVAYDPVIRPRRQEERAAARGSRVPPDDDEATRVMPRRRP